MFFPLSLFAFVVFISLSILSLNLQRQLSGQALQAPGPVRTKPTKTTKPTKLNINPTKFESVPTKPTKPLYEYSSMDKPHQISSPEEFVAFVGPCLSFVSFSLSFVAFVVFVACSISSPWGQGTPFEPVSPPAYEPVSS